MNASADAGLLVGVLLQAGEHQRGEAGRHRMPDALGPAGPAACAGGWPQTSITVPPSNTGPPGQQEVADAAERVEVAARVDGVRAR